MNIEKLSKVADSKRSLRTVTQKDVSLAKRGNRISDSRRTKSIISDSRRTKSRISDSRAKFLKVKYLIRDAENAEELTSSLNQLLDEQTPEEVISNTVEVLTSVIEALENQVESTTPESEVDESIEDSKKLKKVSRKNVKKLKDSRSYRKLKKSIKDDLEETTTTDEAIDAVSNYLESAPAEDVVSAAVEVLSEVVENLSDNVVSENSDETVDSEDLLEEDDVDESITELTDAVKKLKFKTIKDDSFDDDKIVNQYVDTDGTVVTVYEDCDGKNTVVKESPTGEKYVSDSVKLRVKALRKNKRRIK